MRFYRMKCAAVALVAPLVAISVSTSSSADEANNEPPEVWYANGTENTPVCYELAPVKWTYRYLGMQGEYEPYKGLADEIRTLLINTHPTESVLLTKINSYYMKSIPDVHWGSWPIVQTNPYGYVTYNIKTTTPTSNAVITLGPDGDRAGFPSTRYKVPTPAQADWMTYIIYYKIDNTLCSVSINQKRSDFQIG
ncbi:hypothetical protein O3S80_52970 [Streptomyces sp. Lzd4kr]|nr:hypothetical protein [Streptomyces sp. Lzd4kr]